VAAASLPAPAGVSTPAGDASAGQQETIVQLRELLVLAEGERWHFGQAIHDELGQRLSGMAYFAKALQRKLQKAERAESADAGWLTDLANESMTVARGLARGLLPVGTDDPGGLGAALAESCDRAAKTFGIECSLQVDPAFDAGGAAQASHLYHAIQELVTNAVKHGRARQVQVSLDVLTDGQRATVRNDGDRLAVPPPPPGMGLRGVRSRAAYLGARFTLANEAQGTVLATIALPPAPAGAREAA
jgi:signal transduction histidine kinase